MIFFDHSSYSYQTIVSSSKYIELSETVVWNNNSIYALLPQTIKCFMGMQFKRGYNYCDAPVWSQSTGSTKCKANCHQVSICATGNWIKGMFIQ